MQPPREAGNSAWEAAERAWLAFTAENAQVASLVFDGMRARKMGDPATRGVGALPAAVR